MSKVIVNFYHLDANGIAVICRTEICDSLIEADFLTAEEMSRGVYSAIEIQAV